MTNKKVRMTNKEGEGDKQQGEGGKQRGEDDNNKEFVLVAALIHAGEAVVPTEAVGVEPGPQDAYAQGRG
jgi:hypothetical protein